jgi:hypothetical protein
MFTKSMNLDSTVELCEAASEQKRFNLDSTVELCEAASEQKRLTFLAAKMRVSVLSSVCLLVAERGI